MKAITLTQPFATLVALGQKRLETRSWQTSYRGPIAIHAGQGLAGMSKADYAALCTRGYFWSALSGPRGPYNGQTGMYPLPRGAIVAVATLVDINPIYGPWVPTRLQWHCERNWPDWLMDQEVAFGSYSVGRFAWLVEDVRLLAVPIPAKGALGLWEWDAAA